MFMAKLLGAMMIALILWLPNTAEAADLKMSIHIGRLEDGTALGELMINGQLVWRLRISSDGAQPAFVRNHPDDSTTVVVPDVENGMFVLKVFND